MKILNYGSINKDFVYAVEDFVRSGETIKTIEFKDFLGGKVKPKYCRLLNLVIKFFMLVWKIIKNDIQIKII